MPRVLEERLRRQRIERYGKHGEKLSDFQLELLDLEPGVSSEEVEAESQREPLPSGTSGEAGEPKPASKPRRKHPGRNELPAHQKRVEEVIACSAGKCVCGQCGQQTKTPARILPKSVLSDSMIIDLMVNKYCNAKPLYRQQATIRRDAGIELALSTLDDAVLYAGELLVPMAGAMKHELLTGNYIQADETPVGVQTHDKRGRNHQGYLWQYGSPGKGVVFDFCMGRDREGPKLFLGHFQGLLQTDGYKAYDKVGGPGDRTRRVSESCTQKTS
jgi:transposase